MSSLHRTLAINLPAVLIIFASSLFFIAMIVTSNASKEMGLSSSTLSAPLLKDPFHAFHALYGIRSTRLSLLSLSTQRLTLRIEKSKEFVHGYNVTLKAAGYSNKYRERDISLSILRFGL
ncbi:hypothetical protein BDF21DRAFT_398916 [Thamnidium elegans]|nr:hypothetical protein BDF21DRAFT_398916 [Thamnidium elegans]